MRLYIFSIIFINPSLKQIISPLHGKNNKGKEQTVVYTSSANCPDRGSQRERCRNRVLPRQPRKKLLSDSLTKFAKIIFFSKLDNNFDDENFIVHYWNIFFYATKSRIMRKKAKFWKVPLLFHVLFLRKNCHQMEGQPGGHQTHVEMHVKQEWYFFKKFSLTYFYSMSGSNKYLNYGK